MTVCVLAKAIFYESTDIPGREIKLIHDRGPSNIQQSSSRDLTSLSSFAINSDLRTAKTRQIFHTFPL